jgi:hypothetical protein
VASHLGKLDPIQIIGEPSTWSRKLMKACVLPKLQEWEQFDSFADAMQRLGWLPTQKADGPDARSWTFQRSGELLWLVFDDVLGGSLKSESRAIDLQAEAAEIESSLVT